MSQENESFYIEYSFMATIFGAILGIIIPLLFWGLPGLLASSGDFILENHPEQVYWSLGIMLGLFTIVLTVLFRKSHNHIEFFQFFAFSCSILVLYLNIGGIIIESIFGLILAVFFVGKVLNNL
jgi:hypothetical protein